MECGGDLFYREGNTQPVPSILTAQSAPRTSCFCEPNSKAQYTSQDRFQRGFVKPSNWESLVKPLAAFRDRISPTLRGESRSLPHKKGSGSYSAFLISGLRSSLQKYPMPLETEFENLPRKAFVPSSEDHPVPGV